MRCILIGWLCLVTLASAQKPPAANSAPSSKPDPAAVTKAAAPEARKRQVKVFDVKYANAEALAGMLNDLRQGSSPDRAVPQPGLHAIEVEAYSAAFLQSAEELIRRFDVPEMSVAQNHDFEIIAYILAAGRNSGTGPPAPNEPPKDIPKELADAVRQLNETFGYTDVALIDSAIERCREGHNAFTKGNVNGLSDGATQPSTYEMAHHLIRYEPGAKKGSVTLYGFQFKMRLAYLPAGQTTGPAQWQEIAFQTDLNVPEGQSVVVGKSKIGTEDKSLVLVLQVRVAGSAGG